MADGERLILHIGHPKTATSFLQTGFWQHRASLEAAGCAYPTDLPQADGPRSFSPRVRPFGNAKAFCAKVRPNQPTDPAAWGEAWRRIGAYRTRDVLLSSESLFYLRPARIARLARDGAATGRRPLVVAWIDRQDHAALAGWVQNVRNHGETGDPIAFLRRRRPGRFDYLSALDVWAEAFDGALRVRLFRREAMRGGSIWDDFAATAGLPALAALPPPEEANPSPRPGWLALMRAANRMSASPQDAPARWVREAMRRHARPGGAAIRRRYARPTLREAAAETFAEANADLLGRSYLDVPPWAHAYLRFEADAPHPVP